MSRTRLKRLSSSSSLSLLQGIFLTHGSNLDLPHCWRILYHLSHQGSHVYALLATKRQGHLSLGTKSVCWQFGVSLFCEHCTSQAYTMWSLHSTCNPIVSILMRLNLTSFAYLFLFLNDWIKYVI